MSRRFRRQEQMSSRFHNLTSAAVISAWLVLGAQAWAQSDDTDPEMRIEQLENKLRQLTGQNEELQYRNRQLEERLRALQGGSAQAAPVGPSAVAQPNVSQPSAIAVPPNAAYRPPANDLQIAAPAPIIQEPAATPQGAAQDRRRSDAFDPSQSPGAPGAPRALGGGQLPIPAEGPVGAPGGRAAGEPLDLASPAAPGVASPARAANATGGLTTLPPSATPKDEFDLGIGYMQRRDYALAEETMRNFAQKYPSDALTADAQYWLGESFFQRQLYRDAAESFLAVTTKYDKSTKAPDALLRLGQSLAALKEKEAACAALGEVTRKYPRASVGVKQAVDREQKRVKC
jgi:tol-pal system protein YbgF